MAQPTAVEDQVIDVVRQARACDLDEVARQCANLTWNQVFFAVDRLSRSGKIRLIHGGQGSYTVTYLPLQKGQPDRYSLPS